ncbi:MAG: sigma-70 family RNA polymerase sigma factor, partial [Bacteroidota bacterium]
FYSFFCNIICGFTFLTMNDLALWRQLKEGDRSALEKIYRAQAVPLLSYGKKWSKNKQLVEDAIQDLFVELWKNRKTLGDTDSIRRYLLTALRRKIIRMLQKHSKYAQSTPVEDLPFMATLSIDDKIIASELATEQGQKLQMALDQLTKRQKEIIYLRYYQEMDYQAIGEIMELNYQSVRNLTSGALRALRKNWPLVWLGCLWWSWV